MSPYFRKNFARGFGTWPLKGAVLDAALGHAIAAGYRAIDTAQMYENEAEVGRVIANCGIARDDFLITTKVHPNNYTDADFLPSVEASVRALGEIDVLLLHWPPASGDVVGPLKLLEAALQAGLTKAIGVSNFTASMMKIARDTVDAPLATNQVEFHPLLDQSTLLAASKDCDIPLGAYCAVARGRIFGVPVLEEIAAAHGKSVAQIALRWILQKGVSVNAMSTKPGNIAANYAIVDFELSADEMARIDTLGAANDRIVTSDVVPWAPDWD